MAYLHDHGTDPGERMSAEQWRAATRFDGTDVGWVMMSIGMAIGAGIVFLPVQVGLMGIWVFLLSAVIGYPGMYLFQRLFINTLADAKQSQDYPSMIAGYLGRGWGVVLGLPGAALLRDADDLDVRLCHRHHA